MKFFIAFALIAAVASAAVIKPVQVNGRLSEIQQIIDAIHSPSTNPATAAALEQMLQDYLGPSPIAVGPAIIDEVSPIAVGPAIIDHHPISVGPAIIDHHPISVGPAIIDGVSPIAIGPAIIDHHPISVGPAIVGAGDIAVGPAIIDFPLPDGGAVSAPVEVSPVGVAPVEVSPVGVAPVVVGPVTSESSPLVQIIINVKAPAGAGPVVGAVADQPMNIIDVMPVVDPVQVVDDVVDPVQVVDNVVDPVQVVDTPIVVDPVQVVDTPIIVDPVQVVDVAPVAIGTPILPTPVVPSPAVILPEELN